MNIVVGSGPSGVMCALALLDAGQPVTMLDVGRELEPERDDVARALSRSSPDEWDPQLVERIKGHHAVGFSAADLKTVYGSSFPYAQDQLDSIEQIRTNCTLSFARGGLSNVWGASVVPYTAEDLRDWPVGVDEMAACHREVARHVPFSGTTDGLERVHPFHETPRAPLELSRQARFVLDRLTRFEPALNRQGYAFGQSRLAILSGPEADSPGCQYCGLCMTGCPYRVIYDSSQTLNRLVARRDFTYRPGLMVTRIEEPDGETAAVSGISTEGRAVELRGRRVFLACGVLSTLRLMISSLPHDPPPLTIAYPPYFLLPMVSMRNTRDVDHERLHTLSQLYIRIQNRKLSDYPVHLSFYSYNEFMKIRMRLLFGNIPAVATAMERLFLGRLTAIQGYLDSRQAGGIRVEALRSPDPGLPQLKLSASSDGEAARAIRRVARNLLRNAPRTGLIPLLPMLQEGVPGEGNHAGGTFPMRHHPGDFETDRHGRLPAFRRVHMVDSSVLPSIPALPPTYTLMANAYRIGKEAARM
jgi:choline dehydrogenase-like flavoprotein